MIFGMEKCFNCGKTEDSRNFLSFYSQVKEFINPTTHNPTTILICSGCVDELGGKIEAEYWIKDILIDKTKNQMKGMSQS
jgi:hypothetical protein